jgi:hypothetical protein
MPDEIIRQRVADIGNAYIRNNANSGISWGTNSYPSGSIAGWFRGTTAGRGEALSAGSFAGGETSASQTAAVLRNFVNVFTEIRTTRIVIYYLDYRYGTTVQYDGTAVAHTVYGVGDVGSNVGLPGLTAGAEMDLNNLNASCNNLLNNYWANARNTVLTLTNTICHTSCHGNCHCARGRR